jgi:PleD family two-component response regulator
VARSLEGLFKKFGDTTDNLTESTFHTAIEGLNLLDELSVTGVRKDIIEKPPIRMLVVDDEPIARRAVTTALQVTFPRPTNAGSAEEALKLAHDQTFDVVFMDVCMPGKDGYEACLAIRETALNGSTPVVFVTGRSDDEFRTRAFECGGTDYVAKPFIFSEINLKALTLALRSRLVKDQNANASETAAPI